MREGAERSSSAQRGTVRYGSARHSAERCGTVRNSSARHSAVQVHLSVATVVTVITAAAEVFVIIAERDIMD